MMFLNSETCEIGISCEIRTPFSLLVSNSFAYSCLHREMRTPIKYTYIHSKLTALKVYIQGHPCQGFEPGSPVCQHSALTTRLNPHLMYLNLYVIFIECCCLQAYVYSSERVYLYFIESCCLQVYVYKLPVRVQSLQELCRRALLHLVSIQDLSHLSLPVKLCDYVQRRQEPTLSPTQPSTPQSHIVLYGEL
jgi:hypothetical protein